MPGNLYIDIEENMTIFCLSPSVCMPKAINILWKHLDISWDNIRAGGCNMKYQEYDW